MPELTDRQEVAWPKAIADLRRLHRYLPEDLNSWDVKWYEETRPGRGHEISATYNDGEYFAQITMGVYGDPSTSIAQLDWLHTPGDDCDCGCNDEEADRG